MEDEISPYTTPKSSVDIAEEAIEPVAVRRLLRFFNLLIDYVAFSILGILVGLVVAFGFGDPGVQFLETTPSFFIGAPIVLAYYIALEALSGRTLGKLITGTKVVNEAGTKPSFGQIVGRSFARIIPFEAFSFLAEDGRSWHDTLPKTFVVKCR